MDIVTHGLASLAVTRGFFPRAGRAATLAAVLVGIAADLDWLSVYFSPSAYLAWRRTYFHSVLAAICFSIASLALLEIAGRRRKAASEAGPTFRSVLLCGFLAPLCCALLHLAMDACQSAGVALLWPFSARRFALDWLPGIDPWILAILLVCIAVPELLRLVSSEIGAKEKRPRGQKGSLVGLALVLIYIGARADLHSNVVAALESRTFHGEPARRALAFPESLSLLTWHGVVETESAVDQLAVDASEANKLDADLSLRLFKPQNSPALDVARKTAIAKHFLALAQLPKASVEKTEAGYDVVLRDLRYSASGEAQHEVAALIQLDFNDRITSEELVWAKDLLR